MGKTKKAISNDILHKEIDMVQLCITRMAQNSFSCKGWSLTLFVGILALVPENINRLYICILIFGIDMCFWFLDAFYVLQEKKYRAKYAWIIKRRLEGDNRFLYDLNPNNKDMILENEKTYTYLNTAFSKTLLPMYGGIAILDLYFVLSKIILWR